MAREIRRIDIARRPIHAGGRTLDDSAERVAAATWWTTTNRWRR